MKKKIKTLLFTSLTAFLGLSLTTGVLTNTNLSNESVSVFAEEEEEGFERVITDWFTLDAHSYSPTESDVREPEAELEFYLSPKFDDYRSLSKDSFNQLLDKDTGLIGAIKYILSDQVKFIEPVQMSERRTTDSSLVPTYLNRDPILQACISAALTGADISDEKFEEEYEKFIDAMSVGVDNDMINSKGNFLRSVLAYFAAKGTQQDNKTDALNSIASLLGIDGGEVVNVNTGLYNALKDIYDRSGDGSNNIINDIKTIYQDACDIVMNEENESVVLAEIFILVQETSIPMETAVSIFGEEEIKAAVIDIFTNPDIDPEVAKTMLSSFTTDTCYSLCSCVSFTQPEIYEAIASIDPARLLEITRGLDKQALDNIRIILGTANDNGGEISQDKLIRRGEPTSYTFEDHYAEFGGRLVNAVLNNLSVIEMIDAIEALWIAPYDETQSFPYDSDSQYLLYSYNYTDELGSNNDGRRLYLRNLIRFANEALPKLQDLATRSSDKHFEKFHLEVKTPLNEDKIFVDLTLGFQSGKDVTKLNKLIDYIDKLIDFECEFIEGEEQDYSKNTLDYSLTLRPQYLVNMYELLCISFIFFNSEDNRVLEEIFSHLFDSFGNLKAYLASDIALDLVNDLKNIDYESALATLVVAENFNKIFRNANVSQDNINKFIAVFKSVASKLASFTFDKVKEILLPIVGESFVNRLDSNTFKNLIEVLTNYCNKIKDNADKLSMDALLAITNEEVYSLVDLLSEKTDKVNLVKKFIYNLVNVIPDEYNDKSLMDYYDDAGKLVFDETHALDLSRLFAVLPMGEKILSIIRAMIFTEDRLHVSSPNIVVELNEPLSDDSAKVNKVTYTYIVGDESKSLVGLLPEGAKLIDFGPAKIGEKVVDYWVKKDTNDKVELMPNETIVLEPLYVVNVVATASIESFEYDGTTVSTLEATPALSDYTYTYQWQIKQSDGSFADITGATSRQYLVSDIDQSGTYVCKVTTNRGAIYTSNEVTVEVIARSVVDFANTKWDYTSPFAFTNHEHTVSLTNLPEGEGETYTIVYSGNVQTESGTYVATAEIVPADGVLIKNAPNALVWEILSAAPDFWHRNFVSEETSDDGLALSYVTLDGKGIEVNPTFSLVAESTAFDGKEANYEEMIGEKAKVSYAYDLSFTLGGEVCTLIEGESATIKILIPNELKNGKFAIIGFDAEGNVIKLEYTISEDGNYAIIHVDQITSIGIVSARGKSSAFKDNLFLLVILILTIVNIIILLWWFSLTTTRNKNDTRIRLSLVIGALFIVGLPRLIMVFKQRRKNSKESKNS